jgi:hypothetical protein
MKAHIKYFKDVDGKGDWQLVGFNFTNAEQIEVSDFQKGVVMNSVLSSFPGNTVIETISLNNTGKVIEGGTMLNVRVIASRKNPATGAPETKSFDFSNVQSVRVDGTDEFFDIQAVRDANNNVLMEILEDSHVEEDF